MPVQPGKDKNSGGPNLEALGLKSPMEVIDILALLKIDGKPIITDDKAILDPKLKAQAVVEYFHSQFKIKPNDLPYLAYLIKKDLRNNHVRGRVSASV